MEELNDLEKEGVIQRFEFTFELGWNTLKDRMEYDGVAMGLRRVVLFARLQPQG